LSGTTPVSQYQKNPSPTHTYPGHQSSFYHLPSTTTIHSILHVQFMCLTVFLHSLCPSPFWSTSWFGTLHFILYTFLHPIIFFFFTTHAHTIATCFAVVLRLCHLIVVRLLTIYFQLCFCITHPSDYSCLCLLKYRLIILSKYIYKQLW